MRAAGNAVQDGRVLRAATVLTREQCRRTRHRSRIIRLERLVALPDRPVADNVEIGGGAQRRGRVLILAEERDVALACRVLLVENGLEAQLTTAIDELVETASTVPPDVIILDLPNESAHWIYEVRARKTLADVPIVCLARAAVPAQDRVVFLSHPLLPDTLLETVGSILDGGDAIGPPTTTDMSIRTASTVTRSQLLASLDYLKVLREIAGGEPPYLASWDRVLLRRLLDSLRFGPHEASGDDLFTVSRGDQEDLHHWLFLLYDIITGDNYRFTAAERDRIGALATRLRTLHDDRER